MSGTLRNLWAFAVYESHRSGDEGVRKGRKLSGEQTEFVRARSFQNSLKFKIRSGCSIQNSPLNLAVAKSSLAVGG